METTLKIIGLVVEVLGLLLAMAVALGRYLKGMPTTIDVPTEEAT